MKKQNLILFILLISFIILFSNCKKSEETIPVIAFTITPTSIKTGDAAILQWNVNNATTVSIDNGIGVVAASGTKEVRPTMDTTYTLTASNSAGQATMAVVLTIIKSIPSITTFTATPLSINSGDPVTLSWVVANATLVSIDNGIGSVVSTGSITIHPTATTTYTITANNPYGSAQKSVTVTVKNPPVINIFSVDASSVQPGESTFIHWSVTNANLIRIMHNGTLLLDSLQASGSSKITPTSQFNVYRLEAYNNDGNVYKEIEVTVVYPDAEYKVFGVARSNIITISTSTGGTAQFSNVELPWSYKMPHVATGTFLYVSAQNDTTSGCITVEIYKNDTIYKTTTSCGAYVIATASGSY